MIASGFELDQLMPQHIQLINRSGLRRIMNEVRQCADALIPDLGAHVAVREWGRGVLRHSLFHGECGFAVQLLLVTFTIMLQLCALPFNF